MIRAVPRVLRPNAIVPLTIRNYFPERQLMKLRTGKYYINPEDAAERVMRIIAIHDNVKDVAKMTLKSKFEDHGLTSLDLVEVCLGIEDEFDIEFTDEQCESFKRVGDIVECVATNQFVDY